MNIRNMRVILVAAIVAALLGGGVATAKTLISGKDIRNSTITGAKVKNSSLTGSDIKSKSVSISDLTKATQNLIRSGGTSSTTGKPGANGANGATGATGPAGPAGPQGPKGDTGASGDPTPYVITGGNWTVKGFGRWRDSDNDSTIAFDTGALKLGSATGHRVGVQFPIQQGTRVADLETLTYIGNTGLALEVDPSGDKAGAVGAPDYATFVYEPGDTSTTASHNVLTDAKWFSTRDLGTGGTTIPKNTGGKTLKQLLDASAEVAGNGVDDKVRILGGRLGTGSSTGGAAISVQAAGVQVGIKGAPSATYAFTK